MPLPLRPTVRKSAEFERIEALPRRELRQADADAWAEVLTAEYACPGAGARLRPWQAYSIAEAVEHGGAWLALPVGLGKTLITALLPVAFDAKRPVLIVPASLRAKTWSDFRSYAGQWRLSHAPIRIISREELALEANARMLDQIQPDLIMLDEADDLANRKSAAVRRIDRYLVARPDTAVVAMTGTPSRKSIMGYWHLLCWCLRDGAPVPLKESEAEQWAAVLDESTRNPIRPKPGPLGGSLASARAWYARRLRETPGVVIVDGDSCAAPLRIRTRLARECRDLDRAFERFSLEFQNPGGIPISDPLSRWRLDGQLGCGLYTYWDPPPPEEWRAARLAEARFVRQVVARTTHSDRPCDTEGQVLNRYPNHPIVVEWRRVKSMFDERRSTAVAWISDATIRSALAWLDETAPGAEGPTPGIVWCGSVDFAERLTQVSGLEYYGRGGRNAAGLGLHMAPKGRSLIVSWNANKKGFNLQAWRRQLIVLPPQSAKWLEQIFGRSHRSGQDQAVSVDVLLTSGGTIDAFESAVREAQFSRNTVGLTQKVLRAKVLRAKPAITASNQYRWASRTEVEKRDGKKT